MNENWIERQSGSTEARRRYEQERLVLWATDQLSEAMEEAQMSKADLARLLETSRANVTNLLAGGRNMTLRTLADVAFVLGSRVTVALEPLREGRYMSAPVCVVRNLRPRMVTAPRLDHQTSLSLSTPTPEQESGVPSTTLAA